VKKNSITILKIINERIHNNVSKINDELDVLSADSNKSLYLRRIKDLNDEIYHIQFEMEKAIRAMANELIEGETNDKKRNRIDTRIT